MHPTPHATVTETVSEDDFLWLLIGTKHHPKQINLKMSVFVFSKPHIGRTLVQQLICYTKTAVDWLGLIDWRQLIGFLAEEVGGEQLCCLTWNRNRTYRWYLVLRWLGRPFFPFLGFSFSVSDTVVCMLYDLGAQISPPSSSSSSSFFVFFLHLMWVDVPKDK